jgi:mannose-6-phosphate isomerase-like protein (cupin superfamily)
MTLDKINIKDKLQLLNDHWNPRIIAELNGQQIKAVKMLGTFDWHHHENEDEMFLVMEGTLTLEFRDKTVRIAEGEFIVVPKGVEHRPVAEEEVAILLFEPASTLNTGNITNNRTKERLDKI